MDKIVLEGRWVIVKYPSTVEYSYFVNDAEVFVFNDILTKVLSFKGELRHHDDIEAAESYAYEFADTYVMQMDPLGRITIKHPAELPVFSEVAE
jgi:hypothetical protein